MRISELAKELGIESKVVIAYLDSEGHGGYKAANKIEGYLEEMVRDHFPAAKKEEPETAKPKAILRRGTRERSFIPSDERPAEQPEEAKHPQARRADQGSADPRHPERRSCGLGETEEVEDDAALLVGGLCDLR